MGIGRVLSYIYYQQNKNTKAKQKDKNVTFRNEFCVVTGRMVQPSPRPKERF